MSMRFIGVAVGVALFSLSASGEPAPVTSAAEAPKSEGPSSTSAAVAPVAAVGKPIRVSDLRRQMEQNSAEIGRLAQKARKEGDLVKTACVADKQDRAEVLMDVAAPELELLRDRAADGKARAFASEKLGAAATRLSGLLDEARACAGRRGGDDDGTDNQVEASDTVQPRDPTNAPGSGRWFTPPDDATRPPVASPVR